MIPYERARQMQRQGLSIEQIREKLAPEVSQDDLNVILGSLGAPETPANAGLKPITLLDRIWSSRLLMAIVLVGALAALTPLFLLARAIVAGLRE